VGIDDINDCPREVLGTTDTVNAPQKNRNKENGDLCYGSFRGSQQGFDGGSFAFSRHIQTMWDVIWISSKCCDALISLYSQFFEQR